jgi:hypothetical protein
MKGSSKLRIDQKNIMILGSGLAHNTKSENDQSENKETARKKY